MNLYLALGSHTSKKEANHRKVTQTPPFLNLFFLFFHLNHTDSYFQNTPKFFPHTPPPPKKTKKSQTKQKSKRIRSWCGAAPGPPEGGAGASGRRLREAEAPRLQVGGTWLLSRELYALLPSSDPRRWWAWCREPRRWDACTHWPRGRADSPTQRFCGRSRR